jgi:hypothetical protein
MVSQSSLSSSAKRVGPHFVIAGIGQVGASASIASIHHAAHTRSDWKRTKAFSSAWRGYDAIAAAEPKRVRVVKANEPSKPSAPPCGSWWNRFFEIYDLRYTIDAPLFDSSSQILREVSLSVHGSSFAMAAMISFAPDAAFRRALSQSWASARNFSKTSDRPCSRRRCGREAE